ncbi:regulatory-associated protein of mTOR [Caerostris extrusa]|uniref:Regulatory-associated protein of mTOR n=1 Tax=Caerostris extrusa TaxID=172846 RepID=A0AAV4TYE9_CAEEX|nr:regulatory-associated protein of mTOR [Caerostris extrusa]
MSQHGYAGFEIMHMKSLNLYCLILILRYETAIFALGTFLSSTAERTDHANAIDHRAVYNEIVTNNFQAAQQEALAALQWFLIIFENQFVAVGFQYMEEEKAKESAANHLLAPTISDMSFSGDGNSLALDRLRRVSSSTSISSMVSSGIHSPYGALGYASVFGNIWKTLITLSCDPYPEVAKLAEQLINYIRNKVNEIHHSVATKNGKIPSMSEPSSPSGRPSFLTGESPPARPNGVAHTGQDSSRLGKPANRWTDSNAPYQQYQYFAQFNPIRKTFDKGPRVLITVSLEFIN